MQQDALKSPEYWSRRVAQVGLASHLNAHAEAVRADQGQLWADLGPTPGSLFSWDLSLFSWEAWKEELKAGGNAETFLLAVGSFSGTMAVPRQRGSVTETVRDPLVERRPGGEKIIPKVPTPPAPPGRSGGGRAAGLRVVRQSRLRRSDAREVVERLLKSSDPEIRELGRQELARLDACFLAGTLMRTPEGSTPVERLRAGDLILSRGEDDPAGAVEAKPVLRVFVRTGRVLDLRVGGRVIRTTPEHPFRVEGEGWVDAGLLRPGDLLSLEDDGCIAVEGVRDTGEYHTVYNVEVADFHTYFVGCPEWGFSVWAHNAECDLRALLPNLPDNVVREAMKAKTLDEFVRALGKHAPASIVKKRAAFLAARVNGTEPEARRESAKAAAQAAGLEGDVRRDAMDALVGAKIIPMGKRGRGGNPATRSQLKQLADDFDKAGYRPIRGPGSGKTEEPNQRVAGQNLGARPLDLTVQGGRDNAKIRISTASMTERAKNNDPIEAEFTKAKEAVENLAGRKDPHPFVVMVPKESNGYYYIVDVQGKVSPIPEQPVPRLIETLKERGLIK
jgi:hypothetical protein